MQTQRGAVLLILMVILVTAGAAAILSAIDSTRTKTEQQPTKQTLTLLVEAREALVGFAIANGRLPCPAPATAATGTATSGIAPTPPPGAGCTNLAGVLPWVTLGLSETDAWSNRFTYRVTQEFTRSRPLSPTPPVFPSCASDPLLLPAETSFALCSRGDMTISTGGALVAQEIPAVVLSHGRNGNGAYNPQGIQLPSSADVDEQNNKLTAGGTVAPNNFISKTPTETFDDYLIWIPPNLLFNRMIAAGKLPPLP